MIVLWVRGEESEWKEKLGVLEFYGCIISNYNVLEIDILYILLGAGEMPKNVSRTNSQFSALIHTLHSNAVCPPVRISQ